MVNHEKFDLFHQVLGYLAEPYDDPSECGIVDAERVVVVQSSSVRAKRAATRGEIN
jgi:hypothetical protein